MRYYEVVRYIIMAKPNNDRSILMSVPVHGTYAAIIKISYVRASHVLAGSKHNGACILKGVLVIIIARISIPCHEVLYMKPVPVCG